MIVRTARFLFFFFFFFFSSDQFFSFISSFSHILFSLSLSLSLQIPSHRWHKILRHVRSISTTIIWYCQERGCLATATPSLVRLSFSPLFHFFFEISSPVLSSLFSLSLSLLSSLFSLLSFRLDVDLSLLFRCLCPRNVLRVLRVRNFSFFWTILYIPLVDLWHFCFQYRLLFVKGIHEWSETFILIKWCCHAHVSFF